MEPLLQEDELALAVALCADGVLIVLQEVDHAGVGDTGLLGDLDLGNALRVGLQHFIDLGADDLAVHASPLFRTGRSRGTSSSDTQALAGRGNFRFDICQLAFERGLLADQFCQVVVAQQVQLLLEFFGLTCNLLGDIHIRVFSGFGSEYPKPFLDWK